MVKPKEHLVVDKEVKEFLKNKKIHERESFNDVLRRELKLEKKK